MPRWALQRAMIGIVPGLHCSWSCSGFYSNGFSAVYALAHAGFRGVRWVRRGAFSRAQAGAAALALILGLSLAACTVGPDYSPEAAPVPTKFKELKGWKLAAPSDALDRGDWWAPYRDPKLDFLLRQVEISNQTVAAQAAAYEQARAVIREAQAALFPTLTGNYTYTRTRTGPNAGGGGNAAAALGAGPGALYTTTFVPQLVRQLGSRCLGQGAPPNRGQHFRRASKRRRSRQRQAIRAGDACHRLFQLARRGRAARSAHSHGHAI